ncbi:MAG: septum formation protein Maf [Alistipes sp.]|nr:septum formation protein Maf [Alistipes sp.]
MLLHDKLSSKRLILASASPRRRQLLADCDIPFVVAEPFDCNEEYPPQMPSHEVAEYLSGLKSDAYPHTLAADEMLLTADTVVIVDDRILGKPSSAEEAVAMLQMLSGRVHNVVTGVTIRSAERRRSFSVLSSVSFRTLTADEIDYYITRYRPFDKAGSYGIQEWIGYVAIESIEGSFFNVMGLPVQRLYVELGEFVK